MKNGLREAFKRLSTFEINEKNTQEALDEFRLLFLSNDVAADVTNEILTQVGESLKGKRAKRFSDLRKLLEPALKEAVIQVLTPEKEIDLHQLIEERKKKESKPDPLVILFLGINGTGKTTTIAKLAWKLQKSKFRVVLASSDTYRSGAQEQLKIHANRLGIKGIIGGKYGTDSAAVAYDAIQHAKARFAHVVLIDTAGRMAINENLIGEMIKIKRVAQPDYTILVVDALAGNDAVNQARDFDNKIGVDGIVVSKMDADTKGGAALSVTFVLGGKPIVYMGTGQEYADLERFSPKHFVKELFK